MHIVYSMGAKILLNADMGSGDLPVRLETGAPEVCQSPNCVKMLDAAGRITFFDPDGLRLMEIDDVATVVGAYWPDLWPEDGRDTVEANLKIARERGVANFTGPCPTAKGTPKWWDVTIASIPGPEPCYVAISRDITDERARDIEEGLAATALQKLIAGEYAHRVNNILAVVSGLFEQTAKRSADKETLAEGFGGRLKAMARANAASVSDGGKSAPIRDLIDAQLGPFQTPGRLSADGPDVALPAAIAQPFALAIHELATNAIKHGAFSDDAGSVVIEWAIDSENRLIFCWREIGGPPCRQPARTGLGSRLIEHGIPDATVNRVFAPEGFRCEIAIDLG